MVRPDARNAGLLAAMLIAALMTACGPGTSGPKVAANQITGATKCTAAEAQDLNFTGSITGRLSCTTSPSVCSTTNGAPSLAVPLDARVGSSPVQLLVVFRFFADRLTQDRPGTYAAGSLGDAPNSSFYGVTMDGDGHWETPTPGGSITLTVDDAAGASGSIDVHLTDGSKTFAVAGTWKCVRQGGFPTPTPNIP